MLEYSLVPSHNYMILRLKNSGGLTCWFSVVYGFCSSTKRVDLWAETTKPAVLIGTMVILGDFNVVMEASERRMDGRELTKPQPTVDGFNYWVEDVEMCEFSLVGDHFSWNNGQYVRNFVTSKLDKGFIKHEVLTLFPKRKGRELE